MMTRREFGRTLATSAAAAFLPLGSSAQVPGDPPLTAVDTHAHIFDHRLKLAAARRYAPDYDATLDNYLGHLDRHGISHGVLIQPSFLGTDNGYLVQGLRAKPDRLRGVAVVEPAAGAAELAALGSAGIVGIRLNLVGQAVPVLGLPPWSGLLARVKDLGWQVEVHREARDLPQIVDPLLAAGVNVVVDHFGRPDPLRGIDDPGFRYLLGTGHTRRVWVKLSGAYRNGGIERGEAIALEAIPLLRRAFGPERLLWGSDWPHTQFERLTNYEAAVAAFERWISDSSERAVILRDAPRALFSFA
jgi:predicted TIM-barrel fold metal-dependent hydrolase